MSRRSLFVFLASITVFAAFVYGILGEVLPNTPEGNAMRENMTLLAVIMAAIGGLMFASFKEH